MESCSHLLQSLPSAWTLGLLGRLSVQGETLTPCSPDPTASGILVLSGSKFQPISVLVLQTQPAAHSPCTPAYCPIPQPRSQHPPQPQPRGQGSSTDPKGLRSPSPAAFRPKPSEESALRNRVRQERQGEAQDRRWQSQTQDPRLDRAVGNREGVWAQRSWVVMPSSRQWRAAGRSL